MDNHWTRWDAFCVAHNIDPYLKTWADPVPILQVFGEQYRDGRLAPLKNPVKARTVARRARRTPDWGPLTRTGTPSGALTFGSNFRSSRNAKWMTRPA
jgi:hypothetical protein